MAYLEGTKAAGAFLTGQRGNSSGNNILDTVNLYNGSPAFPVSLVSLAGQDQLSISIQMSFQGIPERQWRLNSRNDKASVLGFGWNMPLCRIVAANRSVRESYQSGFYLTGEGGEYPLYRTGKKDGGVSFFSVEHPVWEFLFYENCEAERSCWKIRKEDGSTWTYGGTADSVEIALSWDNWAGAAINNDGEAWPVGWCLSTVESYNGSSISYEYENVKEPLGNAHYTRTMRLKSLISTYGEKIEFSYLPKESSEYQAEHLSVGGQNAYQCQWEDHYLDEIRVTGSTGKLLYTQKLEYELREKRLLVSVTQIDADGKAQMPMCFSYGNDQSDGHSGTLQRVAYPLGEAIRYEYQTMQFPSARGSQKLAAPGTDWSSQIIQGSDFTVVLHQREEEVQLQILYWDMGWQSYELDDFTGKVIQNLQIYTGQGFLAALFYDAGVGSYVVRLIKRNPVRRFEWDTEERILQMEMSEPAVACGQDFFAIQYKSTALLAIAQFDYTDNAWHWNELDQEPEDFQALGAGSGCLLGAFYSKDRREVLLQTYYADESHVWQKGDNHSRGIQVELEATNENSVWSVGQGQASAAFVSLENNQVHAEVVLLRWRTDFTLNDIVSYESFQSFQTANPILYTRVSDTVIGWAHHIYRYTPGNWNPQKLLEPVDGAEYRYAYASDLALAVEKKDNRQRFTALRYDPYRQDWTSDGAPYCEEISDAANICVPCIFGETAVMGRKLFIRGTDECWNTIYDFPANADMSSVQVFPNANYCIYQTEGGDETIVLPLWNQQPHEALSLRGQSCVLDNSLMVRGDAFATCVQGEGSQEKALYLYYLGANYQYEEQQSAAVLSHVTLETGFTEQSYSFSYDEESARLEEGSPAFAHVKVYPEGKGKMLGYTRHSFYNGIDPKSPYAEYPTDPATNVRQFYSHMAGRIYNSKTFDADGKPVTGAYSLFWIMDKLGFCIRETKTVKQTWLEPFDSTCRLERDGERELIEAVIETEYEPRFYLPCKIIKHGADNIQIVQDQTYAWEIYPEILDAHLLDAVIANKKTERSSGQVLEAAASLWEKNADGIWRESSNWEYDGTGDADFDFQPAQAGWFCSNRVLERGEKGEIIRMADADGIQTLTVYDKNSYFAVAEFNGIAGIEPIYCGFEPYERMEGWEGIADNLTERECYSGTRCLELKSGVKVSCKTVLKQCKGPLVLTCAVKTPEGQQSVGTLELLFQTGDRTQSVGISLVPTNGIWQKQTQCISLPELPQDKEVSVTLSLTGAEEGNTLFDALFLTLAGYPGTAYVYQPDTLLQTAQHPNLGKGQMMQYDLRQRPIASSKDDGVFNSCTRYTEGKRLAGENQPDETMAVEMPQGGSLAHFCRGWDFTSQWKITDGWEIARGELSHKKGATASLTWKETPGESFLLYFALAEACTEFQIDMDAIRLCKDAKGWSLYENEKQIAVCTDGPDAVGSCYLLFLHGRMQFSVEEISVFACMMDIRSINQLRMSFSSPCRLPGLGFCQKPKIKLSYTDYLGRALQDQAVTENGVITGQTLYDDMGQAAVTTQAAEIRDYFWGYRPDFVRDFDWEKGIMTGEIADAYPDSQGYPYSRIMYQQSPAPRAKAFGQPGKDWAICGTAVEDAPVRQNQYADPQKYKNCRIESIREADGKLTSTVYDVSDRQVAVLESGAGDATRQTTFEYDAKGQLVRTILPNALTTEADYDFLGNPTKKSTPDSGISYTAYDRQGRLRYSQSADNRKDGCIIYHVYDIFGRETEVGQYSGIWEEEIMHKRAWEEPCSHVPEGAIWKRRMEYDGDGTDPLLIGKLWHCYSNWTDTVVTETFAYDEYGNIVRHVQNIDGREETVCMEYNIAKQIVRQYVLPDNGLDQRFTYDLQGRMNAVYNKGICLCQYEYLPDGGICREIFAPDGTGRLERNYSYNACHWLTKMEDRYFTQTLSYQKGDGKNGRITEEETEFSPACKLPEDVLQKVHLSYTYDGLGRLAGVSGQIEQALELSYDANGNLDYLNGRELPYQEGTNRLLQIQDRTYDYSDSGAAVSVSEYRMRYDQVLQVVTAMNTEEEETRYYYNGSNGVSACDESRGRTYYLLNTQGKILSRTTPDGRVCICIRGANGIFAMLCDGKIYYLIKDQRGSVRAIYDGEKICAAYHYQPFGGFLGNIWESEEVKALLPFRFTGQLLESCGLYRFLVRWYDPVSGRFLGIDPETQYASPYLYGGADWINYIDPDGAFSGWSIFAGIVGALWVVAGAALSICTAGIASPAGAFFATLGATALIGMGMGTAIYAVTSSITGDFNWKDCLVNAGAGAVFGMIGAGIGAAFPAGFTIFGLSSAVSSYIVDIGVGVVVGATDGMVTNGCLNVVHGKSFAESIGWNIMSGALMGGIMSGISGLGHALRNVRTLAGGERIGGIVIGRIKTDRPISHISVWRETNFGGQTILNGTDHVPGIGIANNGRLVSCTEERLLDDTYYLQNIANNNNTNTNAESCNINVPVTVKNNLPIPAQTNTLTNVRFNLLTNNCTTYAVDVMAKAGISTPIWVRSPAILMKWTRMFTRWQ